MYIWQNPQTSTPKMGRQNHRHTEGLPLKRTRKKTSAHLGLLKNRVFRPLYTERSRRLFPEFPIIALDIPDR